MEPHIVQLAPNEFRFEYKNQKSVPRLKKGQKFKYDDNTFRIVYFAQVFGERVYCSFLVIAKSQ